MSDYPPFMNAYGNVSKILNKIKEAKTPDRFSQDFLATVLGFSGGGARPFIPLAKRLGLLASDGAPTEREYLGRLVFGDSRSLLFGIRHKSTIERIVELAVATINTAGHGRNE